MRFTDKGCTPPGDTEEGVLITQEASTCGEERRKSWLSFKTAEIRRIALGKNIASINWTNINAATQKNIIIIIIIMDKLCGIGEKKKNINQRDKGQQFQNGGENAWCKDGGHNEDGGRCGGRVITQKKTDKASST